MSLEQAEFSFPSTRYSGSKLRLLDWIWKHLSAVEFESALDVLGGTASVSLLLKHHGKQVLYNDLLEFNQILGKAIIENDSVTVTEEDVQQVLTFGQHEYPNFIQTEFEGVFFNQDENEWLDRAVTNIRNVHNEYKRAILMSAVFQACLAKRPFNLFHRANLYLRINEVERSFGNKTTWERSFPELLRRYVSEYNDAVFSNGKRNKVIGGYDAVESPNGVDLVYLDPPYFSKSSSYGTNYLAFYHFLEGLANYEKWTASKTNLYGKTKRLPDKEGIQRFTRKANVEESFGQLLDRFRDNIIALSYQDNGVPSRKQIEGILRNLGKTVEVFETRHKYVLSRKNEVELLFIAV